MNWLSKAMDGTVEGAVARAFGKLSSRRKLVVKAQTEFAGRFGNEPSSKRSIPKSELEDYRGAFGNSEKACGVQRRSSPSTEIRRRESAQSAPTSIFDKGLLR